MEAVIRKIKRDLPSDIEKGIKYYSILSIMSDMKLRKKELELLAFVSVKGNITHPSLRAEFIRIFDSSSQSLENTKSRLRKKKWLVNIDGKCKVNPRVNLDLTKDVILQINIVNENGQGRIDSRNGQRSEFTTGVSQAGSSVSVPRLSEDGKGGLRDSNDRLRSVQSKSRETEAQV